MKTQAFLFLAAIGTTVSTSALVINPDNGHAYDAIPGALSWDDARSAAEAAGGYLATITSQEENDFIAAAFPSAVSLGFWLGGFQPGGTEPDEGWEWVTGEAFAYTNWAAGEPNNVGGIEHYLHFDNFGTGGGTWNDLPPAIFPSAVDGYVIEFNAAPIPDGGTTASLLGLAMIGLGCAARRNRN